MSINRRDFLKTQAIAAAAATAGIATPALAAGKGDAPAADGAPSSAVRWDKAPCRFCGTGCSVLVGVQNGRVVAT
ncbi:MAG: twin-arginine translocation signal domain-containing protein, partial [Rhodocyclales bacterium]|nr:twin-arginine translocation signal domain-containing protein [Rhodocyclales bacterium]